MWPCGTANVMGRKAFRLFANRFHCTKNHYAGHGPATVKLFWQLYDKQK
jgi:hypothetical protein